MKEIIFATNNPHKLYEISAILGAEYKILSLTDIGCEEEIPETADTLQGNAELKARYVYERYGKSCFSDDTGLEVEALNGAPGVHSARYAGEWKNSQANMEKLLAALQGESNRKARFRTVIAFVENGKTYFFDGEIRGTIINEKRGSEGFGYDPIFVPEGYDKTFAELPLEAKNTNSHRANAVKKLVDFLENKHF
ncbi:MAG: non-canonical purine NTP diphosphatase [Prevotellaceae bacterium]|jgi:XTP/dITP diphosphohydrolase|nr:non-canonical purine NTP diphosphatase [Prevotellaceae bacterium]